MSVDTNIYLGPYVRCKKEYVPITEERKGCPKCKSDFQAGSFCAVCGGKTGTFRVEMETEKVEPFAFTAALKERLYFAGANTEFSNDFEFYLPNVSIPGIDREKRLDGDENICQAIDSDQISEEKRVFSKFFSKELAKIKKAYGEYFIEWGVLKWYS
jgi:hypothetical protein